jgi:hypothetical protein
MRSSTSHHASFDRRLLALLFTGIVGAPLLWLAALQTGYTLAYHACDARTTSWVGVPTFIMLGIVTTVAVTSWFAHRRAQRDRVPLPLLGEVAVGVGALMVIVMVASALAPVMLRPCD